MNIPSLRQRKAADEAIAVSDGATAERKISASASVRIKPALVPLKQALFLYRRETGTASLIVALLAAALEWPIFRYGLSHSYLNSPTTFSLWPSAAGCSYRFCIMQ